MTVKARVICDSVNPSGTRLTTFVVYYPRFILAEVNTHRMLSRSTASSRAIPVKKRVQQIKDDPVIPRWGINKPGMQADEEASPEIAEQAEGIWLDAMNHSIDAALKLAALNIHKQASNRLLEPFVHASTILTATDWENFFALRYHPKAQPEFYDLATAMKDAFFESVPAKLAWGEWHLPFITEKEKLGRVIRVVDGVAPEEEDLYHLKDLVKASAARCARVSYENHEGGTPEIVKDLETAMKLLGDFPVHASPAEHQAYACAGYVKCTKQTDPDPRFIDVRYCDHGNVKGFHQFRKTLKNENITVFPWDKEYENATR